MPVNSTMNKNRVSNSLHENISQNQYPPGSGYRQQDSSPHPDLSKSVSSWQHGAVSVLNIFLDFSLFQDRIRFSFSFLFRNFRAGWGRIKRGRCFVLWLKLEIRNAVLEVWGDLLRGRGLELLRESFLEEVKVGPSVWWKWRTLSPSPSSSKSAKSSLFSISRNELDE